MVKEELYYQWKEQCNIVNETMSYKVWCDGEGLHETMYDDQECNKVDDASYLKNCEHNYNKGKWTLHWNNCQQAPVGAKVYIIVRTSQFENTKVVVDNNVNKFKYSCN